MWPTVIHERSREGIDDLKYMLKLEQLVADAKQSGRARTEGSPMEVHSTAGARA